MANVNGMTYDNYSVYQIDAIGLGQNTEKIGCISISPLRVAAP